MPSKEQDPYHEKAFRFLPCLSQIEGNRTDLLNLNYKNKF